MKKIFSLFAAILFAGSMMAETVEFTPSNCTSWTSSQGSQSQTISGITISSDKAANNTQLRLYADGTHTITSTVGNITSIVFTCTAKGTANYGPGKLSGEGYEASSDYTGEWTGSSASVTVEGGQARCTSILVTYTPTAPAYTITAQSNNESLGTVSLIGSVITGSPKAGCRYASPAYSVSPNGSATVSQEGNEFTVTPSANTTVTINFEAIPKYTVSFSTGTGNPTVDPISEEVGGEGIDLPAGPTPACANWTFAGWAAAAVEESTTTAPTLLAAGSNYKPANNVTLFAVYKTEAGSETGIQNYTITFNNNGSDATSDISSEDFLKYITENASKVSRVSDIVKCYKGATGLKLSSKKNNGSFVLTLAESAAITKVVLNTKKKSTTQGASYEVEIGGTAFSTSSTLSKDNFVDVEFTGTKTTSDELSIASLSSTAEGTDSDGRVAWLKSITVYYEAEVISYNYISSPSCDPTAIDNAEAEVKAVKFVENGQLFIEKNGHVYNVQGQIVK